MVLQVVEQLAAGEEALERPVDETEESQLLGRRRVDGESVGVVGVTLGGTHGVGVTVDPHGALAQQPVGGEPGAAEHQRRPPGVGEEGERRRRAAHHFHQAAGDEVDVDVHRRAGHAEVEVAGGDEVAGERRILEVAEPRRRHAGGGQAVIEPGGDAAAEVGADRLVQRGEHLQQHEDDADAGERRREVAMALQGADHRPAGEGEEGRQRAAEEQHRPPGGGEAGRGPRQSGEELPLVARA